MSDETAFARFINTVYTTIDTPVVWFRKTIVEPNQQEYYWYHRQFRRVPTIDQCYTDDINCYYEANEQFKRDKHVDDEIVSLLRRRKEECRQYEGQDHPVNCVQVTKDYDEAVAAWFTKYGDLGAFRDVVGAFMKQKHRIAWERRHGPVGTGMKSESVMD